MKRRIPCSGCGTKIGPNDDGINVTSRGDDGVVSVSAVCLPCMIRVIRDPDFAKRLDANAAAVLTGMLEA